MDHSIKVKLKIIKLREENIGTNLHSLGSGKDFLDMTLKT